MRSKTFLSQNSNIDLEVNEDIRDLKERIIEMPLIFDQAFEDGPKQDD